VEPEDQRNIPTKHVIMPGSGEPSQGVSGSNAAALFGAGRSHASGGPWQPPSPEELQRDFPLYEIRGILGRGGMGAVYKGWQKSLDRYVAIKILPPNLDDSIGGFTERFKREAKAMAQLEHPGIVAVYDAGTTPGGLLYFVMQCVEGTDVQRLVTDRKRLDPGEALRITSAVCDALGYAHDHGIIHRDIKPSNIMLDGSGNVKVADFGLAKSVSADTTMLTMSNVSMGTPDFMAPEALRGSANADHRADLYAVGVMLYQMLTGEIPRGRFIPPSRAVPGLDKRLDLIVDKALQPEPAARYSTAIEVKAAIEPITRTLAKRVATVTSASASRKKPLLIGIAVAVLAAIAALVHFAPWKKDASGGTAASTKPIASIAEVSKATKDKPFVNTLGMKFVPVPGTQALFSIWDTRVVDYAAYARANKVADDWTKAERDGEQVSREPEYPVVGVNWGDANAFCQWLTEKESADGKLPKGFRYRLPTDEEWSIAVGLAKEGIRLRGHT
jgi:serine/threonine protein kinase